MRSQEIGVAERRLSPPIASRGANIDAVATGGLVKQGSGAQHAGFVPPPYPYDRLDKLAEIGAALPGGLVDCSIGTPIDAPPDAVLQVLGSSGTERGYPSSAGSATFRAAAAGWLQRRFGVGADPAHLGACVGTKEFVASTPKYLALRDPSRDTVLYPAVSYPTYAMGATLGGCRAIAVPPMRADGTGLDLGAVDRGDIDRALMLWANAPSNPTGGTFDLDVVAAWGRAHEVAVFSDECYAEFTWSGRARSILDSGPEGVVAVHSLSKTFNLAGARVGFYAGDPELVGYLRSVRQHAGLMVPGPVQAAAVAALADDGAVEVQRNRYLGRLEAMAATLAAAGIPTKLPEGGFYLWVRVPPQWGDAWALAADLARVGGLLVSPGDLYGDDGAGYVRVAMVQPLERLDLVAQRLAGTALLGT
jgi:aspartate/methionine/tyrosine aminotransferase